MRYEQRARRATWFEVLVSSTMLKKVLLGGIGLPFLLQPATLQAQIAVDPNAGAAHRPDIVAAPNGVPSIDIVTPNGKGLSHNKYYDFNIGNPGVILNNHAQEVGQSQLGGIMPGNPHLRSSGSAKVILNEVTSSKRSALNGPAEVFGSPADVIIANPNGISCDGCGFINTPHATLTTGVPEIDGSGFLKGFEVQGGDITFGPQGANFFSGQGSVDIVDIVSRTVHFEGAVAGRTIGVTAGTGHFDYASRQMKELTDITGKPEYAIDGSALGALQADRIKLVATEKGVGVRMRHDMAANAGQLHLSADGKISLKDVFGHDGVVLQSKSDTLHAKHITSKKHVEIAAKKGITLETVGADGHLSVDAQDGLLTISGKATSGSNLELSSRHALQVSGLGAGADVILESGGALNIGGTVLAGGNLRAHAGGDIQAYFLAGGVDMAATQAAGSLVLGSHGDVDLQSGGGIINAANIYGAGNVTLVAYHGLSVSQTILSHQNVAIHVEPHAGIHFGQVLAHGRADIHGGAVDFSTMMTGDDAVLKVGSLDAGTLMTGLDFVHSQVSPSNPTGDLVFHDKGALSITAQRGVKVGHIISGGNIDLFAGNDIYYDQIIGYGTATLTSVSGGISVENVLSAKGDVRLTANTLDLSNNRSHIYTPQTLYLTADHIYVSGSKLIYGGLDFQSTNVLDIHHARLQAVTDEGGTGDILFVAPGVMVDEATSVLAARDFVIKTGELENSGQLAAGHDLAFSVRGDATNSKTGLIYVKGNGALQVDGALRNDFGAIVAEGDLSFTNADGTGKSLSLVNKAGFIQAGGNLNIQTNSLKNEADSTPVITEKTEEVAIAFEKPEGFDSIKNAILYHTTSIANELGMELWGVSYKEAECSGNTCNLHIKNSLANKEATYGKITLEDGIVYKAFTWKEENKSWLFFQGYRWNNLSHMIQKTVTQEFSPTRQGMIQSHGNLIINADTIDNHYSSIEAGGNADIHANVLTNLGATAYKNTYMGCQANTDAYCYAYNADGSRNVALDIINNDGFRQTGSKVLDSVSGLVQAGGTLNLVVDQLNNTAAKGSITGDAHFEAKTVEGNPLEDLSGLTGAGALFTPKVDLNNAGELSDGSSLPLPKPQSGGVGGTLPKQNFIYETRAEFLDVGKFYGSAYYLNRIGYNPDREIFFLGDAYFEKQLIEKQMRDLVGQGLGKGSFIPGSDAIEQVKNLLDVGADYAKTHNLTFGEALSEEQLASLEAPMVIYVRQQVKGMDVYAPVLYIPEKDRASFVSAGALIMGDDVNITSQNTSNSTITNSGRIAASHQLHVHGGDILAQGGHFAAGGDAVILAENNIRFDAGRTSVEGVETVLNTDALSAGGNASVIAKQDITASGVKITTKGDLAMATEQGNLTIGSAQTHYHSEQGDATMHHKSQVISGGSTTLASGKDLNVLGSDVQIKDNLLLKAEGNVSIDATRNSMDNHTQDGQTSHVTLHNGSHLSSGKDTTVLSGQDIHIAASDIDAKGNVGLGAKGEITVGVRDDEVEYHLQGNNLKVDMQATHAVGSSIKSGGDTTVVAGQDGKAHDLSITGSSIAAEGKVGLKSSNDILITNAENSLHHEMSYHKEGGTFSSSKSEHNKIDATEVVSSLITGGKGVALESEKDTTIIGSMLLAGKQEATPGENAQGEKTPAEQAKADITIHSGGNILIKGAQEHYDQQQQSSESGFLHEKSSNSSQSHTTTVSSVLGATGNVDLQAEKETTITASHLLSGQNINVSAESVTIDGMTDHHKSHSETHETGFGVGSGKGFVSIYGSEGKTENEESFEHQGSSLNADGNINITARTKDVNVVGSDFAGENINLSAAHDVNVSPGHDRHTSSSKEERSGFGIQFEKSSSGASVGVGVASAKDTGDQWENTSVQSHFTARQDVQIAADNDVNLQATNVSANRDVNIDAGNTITLSESYDTSNAQETHETSFAGVTASGDIGVLGTVQGLKDAADHMNNKDGNNTVLNGILTGLKINHLFNKGRNFVDWLTGNTGERGNITKTLGSTLGGMGGSTKDALANMAGASGSVTVGFKTEKAEASAQTSTAVTNSIEAGRAVNMHAHKGSIHGVGADIIAGSNPVYARGNDAQSGNITLEAGKDITFESAQNVQSTQNSSESTSMSVGYGYGTGSAGATGNAAFSQGEGSSEAVQQKNAHIIGTGTVHTTSGGNTTLEGAVVSGERVEMEVGGAFTITSRSDTGQTSSKQNSVSVGFGAGQTGGGGSMSASFQKDQSSSDYHSVVEQSGIKAGDGGFKINVKDKTTLTGGIIASTAPVDKNSLTTGRIATSDITNSAHAQASSHGFSLSGNDTIKNIAKNVLNHGKVHNGAEGETKSAISDGTIILTGATNQRAMVQDAGQIIDALNRNTAAAHQAVAPIDATSLEGVVHNRLDMINKLSDEIFDYRDKVNEITYLKEHPVGEVVHDENGKVLYLTNENGEYIKDNDGEYIALYHYLMPEEEKYLQAGSDGNRRMFYNGISNTPDEAARNAVQLVDNEHEPFYFTYHPKAEDKLVEFGIAIYEYFGGWSNSTTKLQDFIYRYGNTGAIVNAHSRGSLTVGNGMRDFAKHGIHGIAEKTDIYLFGPADNSLSIANALYYVSDGKKDHIYLQNHIFDPIGTVFGYNFPTFYKVPLKFPYALFPAATPMIEQGKALGGFKPSTHRCYGNAGDACERDYGTHHNDNTKIYAPRAILDYLGLGYLWRKK